MRIAAKGAIVLLAVLATVIGVAVFSSHEPDAAAPKKTPDATAVADPVTASPSSATPSAAGSSADVDVPAAVRKFVVNYSQPSGDRKAWAKRMSPYTTPELYASLATSDRELAEGATQIREDSDGRVSVGTATDTVYSLQYERLEPDDDEGGGSSQWIVTGIDFMDPPKGAALPLGENGTEEVREPVQDALTAVLAQPGGQSEKSREQSIRETFLHPAHALKTPRPAKDGSAVRIGNAHELVLAAEGDQLVVYATVPYAADGSDDPEWATVTVDLARGDDGTWVPQDAHL